MLLIHMAGKVCPECGYPINDETTCPECGYPIGDINIRANEASSEFNETKPYSPFSEKAWIFKTPFPLKNYPRGAFAKKHRILGWLFGPVHIANNGDIKDNEYFDVINNIFLLINISLKALLYVFVWVLFKTWWMILLTILAFCVSDKLGIVLCILLWIFIMILSISSIYASYTRYTPIFIKTYRRIRKRHWMSMYKAIKNNNINLD